jgi:aspartate/methionine/tyrosine aminotransferase
VCSWRVGWLALHDRHGILSEVRKGLFALTQLILGANSLVLSTLPSILTPAAGSADEVELKAFQEKVIKQLEVRFESLCMFMHLDL